MAVKTALRARRKCLHASARNGKQEQEVDEIPSEREALSGRSAVSQAVVMRAKINEADKLVAGSLEWRCGFTFGDRPLFMQYHPNLQT